MTDPAYSLINTVDLRSGIETGSDDYPWNVPANAILSDGSYCLAVLWTSPSSSPIRFFHLSSDLTVLGSTDLDFGPTGYPTPYLVALPNNQVFLFSRMAHVFSGYIAGQPRYNQTWATWIMDCSGNIPVPGAALPVEIIGTGPYVDAQIFDVYDPVNDRIILTVYFDGRLVVWVFRASTGALLSEGEAFDEHYPIGLYMDPNDSTKFKVPTLYSGLVHEFTIALDGSSVTLDRTTWDSDPDAPMAGGSPYLEGGGGFISSQHPELGIVVPETRYIEYWNYSTSYEAIEGVPAASLASVARPPGKIPLYLGDAACLGDAVCQVDDRYLVHVFEEVAGYAFPSPVTNAHVKALVFVGVDQLATPPTIEVLDLPYYGLPSGQTTATNTKFSSRAATVTADKATGIILVTAYAWTVTPGPSYDSLFVWTIQGPSCLVGVPPLRQRARDDGLGAGTRHEVGGGSSLQSSTRRGGATYY